jgi:hypothetical protein
MDDVTTSERALVLVICKPKFNIPTYTRDDLSEATARGSTYSIAA